MTTSRSRNLSIRAMTMLLAVAILCCIIAPAAFALPSDGTHDLNTGGSVALTGSFDSAKSYESTHYYKTNSTNIYMKLYGSKATSLNVTLYRSGVSASLSEISKVLPTSQPLSANYNFTGLSYNNLYYFKFIQSSGSTISVNGPIYQ